MMFATPGHAVMVSHERKSRLTLLARQPGKAPQPGGANDHHHSREAEAFYVIAGTIRFSIDGHALMLEKGSFLHAEPGQKYSFEAVGSSPCEILILYAPAGLERFIIESGIADPPDEALSRQAAVRSVEEAHGLMTAAPAYGVRYTAVEKP